MKPTTSAPATGTNTSQTPRRLAAGDASEVPHLWKKNRLVNRPISFRSANAMNELANPMKMARAEIASTRGVMVKSPSLSRSEEHTSELQSLRHLVCRLLLEKK